MNENQIKKITSLAHVKYRRKYGLFLVEGAHLVTELLRSNWVMESIVFSDNEFHEASATNVLEIARKRNISVQVIAERLFVKLSTTEAPQGIMAVAVIPEMSFEQVLSRNRILVADGISDPGNLGTIIRTALAFGFEGLITTIGSADIYSPKVVRSTQGAMFRMVFIEHSKPPDVVDMLKSSHPMYTLSPHKGEDIKALKIPEKMSLIVGAEISGVDRIFLQAARQRARIPMSGSVESLNSAIAAGIAMYEISQSSDK